MFENIQVGDVVLFRKRVYLHFGFTRDFLIPRKVTRITPKRFIIEKAAFQFNKVTGHCVGGDGPYCVLFSAERNEIEAHNEFVQCVNRSKEISDRARSMLSELNKYCLKMEYSETILESDRLDDIEQLVIDCFERITEYKEK